MKRCCVCKAVKPITEYNKNRAKEDGLQSLCRGCQKAACKKYQAASKGQETRSKYKQSDKAKQSDDNYRKSAKGKSVLKESQRKFRQQHADISKAHRAVEFAVATGKLIRPSLCSACGMPSLTQAHHTDYAKPLEVTWLCRACHLAVHKDIKTQI